MGEKQITYRDLLIWQRGMELASDVYELTVSLPTFEKYGLKSQMCRAAVSIPSNIAEGWARNSTKDFIRFLSIAKGSIAELETQMLLAQQTGVLPDSHCEQLLAKSLELTKILATSIISLKKKIEKAPIPGA